MTRQLDQNLLPYPVTEAFLTNELKSNTFHAFSVYRNNLLIGHAAIRELSPTSAEICRVIIADPNYRGQGLGRELVESLLDIAGHNLKKKVIVAHLYEWNTDGIRCYTNAGFKRKPSLDETHHFDGENWESLGFELHFTSI